MELIKKTVSLEYSTDRTYNSPTWGQVTATTFSFKIMLTQSINDMGLFTDMSFIPYDNTGNSPPNYTLLTNELNSSGFTFPFMSSYTQPTITGITGIENYILRLPSSDVTSYYNYGNLVITGSTDSKIDDLRSYNFLTPYIVGFDMDKTIYTNYENITVSGISRVVSINDPKIYVFDTIYNTYIGTSLQLYGLAYQDFSSITRTFLIDEVSTTIPLTNFNFIGEGWNQTNTSLSAITKQEYLFGTVFQPKVASDVFIDRGITNIMDTHLRLAEIKNLNELQQYGNGFYKLTIN